MVYLFSRTNIPKNKTIKHNRIEWLLGLEPSLIAKYDTHIVMNSYIVCPLAALEHCKCIVTTIRLSGSS